MRENLGEISNQQKKYNVVPISIALISAGFFCMLSETLLNMALKNLMIQFNISANSVQWLSTGYMLVMGILIPISAFLIQNFTTRKLFITAISTFVLGTVISGLAPIFPILLLGRLIQAVGTGILIPNIVNTLIIINPPEKRGQALGVFNLVMFCAPAIGPTVSGLIIQSFNWRCLFFCTLPFSIITGIIGYIYMENVTDLTKTDLDVISILLSTIGFGSFIFGISNIGNLSVTKMVIPLIIGCVALILFVLRQLHMKNPMLDVRIFKYPMFSIGTIHIIIMHMVNFSLMLILPMFLEGALGISAFKAGLILLPGGLINGLVAPFAGHLYDKHGPKALILPGYAMSTVVFILLFRTISTSISIPLLILLHCLSLIAVSMINTPSQTNSLNQLTPNENPHGTAILNTLQQIAGAFGTSLFVAIMSTNQKNYLSGLATPNNPKQQALALTFGVKRTLMFEIAFLVIALILAFFLKRNNASSDYDYDLEYSELDSPLV